MAGGSAASGTESGACAVEEAGDVGVATTTPDENGESEVLNALKTLQPSLDNKIGDMKAKAKALKLEKKRVAKELRNAAKRRRRLRARCKELPAEDLLEVLAMRRVRDEEQKSLADAGQLD